MFVFLRCRDVFDLKCHSEISAKIMFLSLEEVGGDLGAWQGVFVFLLERFRLNYYGSAVQCNGLT